MAEEDGMKVIFEENWTDEIGCKCRMTIETHGGEAVSVEDQEFIRRILPFAAGKILEASAPDLIEEG